MRASSICPAPSATASCPIRPRAPVEIAYLCSPNNPTGAVMTRAQLEAWVAWARARDAVLIFDAAYDAYISDPALPRSIYEIPGARECAIEMRSYLEARGLHGRALRVHGDPEGASPARTASGERVPLHGLWSRRHATKFNGVPYVDPARGRGRLHARGPQADRASRSRTTWPTRRRSGAGLGAAGFTLLRRRARALRLGAHAGRPLELGLLRPAARARPTSSCTPGSGFGAAGEGYFRLSAFNSRENVEEAIAPDRARVRELSASRVTPSFPGVKSRSPSADGSGSRGRAERPRRRWPPARSARIRSVFHRVIPMSWSERREPLAGPARQGDASGVPRPRSAAADGGTSASTGEPPVPPDHWCRSSVRHTTRGRRPQARGDPRALLDPGEGWDAHPRVRRGAADPRGDRSGHGGLAVGRGLPRGARDPAGWRRHVRPAARCATASSSTSTTTPAASGCSRSPPASRRCCSCTAGCACPRTTGRSTRTTPTSTRCSGSGACSTTAACASCGPRRATCCCRSCASRARSTRTDPSSRGCAACRRARSPTRSAGSTSCSCASASCKQAGAWAKKDVYAYTIEMLRSIDALVYQFEDFGDYTRIEEIYGHVEIGPRQVAVVCRDRSGIYTVEQHLKTHWGDQLSLIALENQPGHYTLRRVSSLDGPDLEPAYDAAEPDRSRRRRPAARQALGRIGRHRRFTAAARHAARVGRGDRDPRARLSQARARAARCARTATAFAVGLAFLAFWPLAAALPSPDLSDARAARSAPRSSSAMVALLALAVGTVATRGASRWRPWVFGWRMPAPGRWWVLAARR